MTARRTAGIPLDLALQMIPDRWNEEAIGGIDSESDIADVAYPGYCSPQYKRPVRHRDASSEEEMNFVSERMNHKGS